jgi:hypothetical protein
MTSVTVFQWQVAHTHPAITLNLLLKQSEDNKHLKTKEHGVLEDLIVKAIQICNKIKWSFDDTCEPMDVDING